jgi:hypothetical protein
VRWGIFTVVASLLSGTPMFLHNLLSVLTGKPFFKATITSSNRPAWIPIDRPIMVAFLSYVYSHFANIN